MPNAAEQPVPWFGRNLQIAFWLVLITFTTYFSMLSLSWQAAVLRNALVMCCHVINFYVCYNVLVPRYYERKKYLAAFGGLFLLLLVLTPVRYIIEKNFVITANLQARFGLAGLIGFMMFTQLIIAGFASLLRLTVSNELNRQRVIILEKAQLDAELKFLKAQMNPHFLFNTINNIYSLALVKSDQTPEALMRLSGLLRYLLYESPGKVALMRELDALQVYAELFQLKFEEPLNLVINFEIDTRQECWIEPHLLIPILENTLKHSGLGVDQTAFAVFSILEDERNIWVEVENSRTPWPSGAETGGIGLANIRKRLTMVYPGNHTFKISETQDRFSLTLIIPKQ